MDRKFSNSSKRREGEKKEIRSWSIINSLGAWHIDRKGSITCGFTDFLSFFFVNWQMNLVKSLYFTPLYRIDILIFAFYFQETTMKRDVWVKNETFFAKCNGVKYYRRVILLAFHSWFIIINNDKYLVKNRKSFFRNYFTPLCFVKVEVV